MPDFCCMKWGKRPEASSLWNADFVTDFKLTNGYWYLNIQLFVHLQIWYTSVNYDVIEPETKYEQNWFGSTARRIIQSYREVYLKYSCQIYNSLNGLHLVGLERQNHNLWSFFSLLKKIELWNSIISILRLQQEMSFWNSQKFFKNEIIVYNYSILWHAVQIYFFFKLFCHQVRVKYICNVWTIILLSSRHTSFVNIVHRFVASKRSFQVVSIFFSFLVTW